MDVIHSQGGHISVDSVIFFACYKLFFRHDSLDNVAGIDAV